MSIDQLTCNCSLVNCNYQVDINSIFIQCVRIPRIKIHAMVFVMSIHKYKNIKNFVFESQNTNTREAAQLLWKYRR